MKPKEAINNLKYAFSTMGVDGDFSEETIDMAISALEKQEPQSPKIKGLLFYSYHMYGTCPCCKGQVEEGWRFCPWCGQAIEWEGEE